MPHQKWKQTKLNPLCNLVCITFHALQYTLTQPHTFTMSNTLLQKFYFNAFDDHTQKLKSFQYRVYLCISALELDVLQSRQVKLWMFISWSHSVHRGYCYSRKTVNFYNSLQLFQALTESGRIISPYLLIHKEDLERLGSKLSTKWVPI